MATPAAVSAVKPPKKARAVPTRANTLRGILSKLEALNKVEPGAAKATLAAASALYS